MDRMQLRILGISGYVSFQCRRDNLKLLRKKLSVKNYSDEAGPGFEDCLYGQIEVARPPGTQAAPSPQMGSELYEV